MQSDAARACFGTSVSLLLLHLQYYHNFTTNIIRKLTSSTKHQLAHSKYKEYVSIICVCDLMALLQNEIQIYYVTLS